MECPARYTRFGSIENDAIASSHDSRKSSCPRPTHHVDEPRALGEMMMLSRSSPSWRMIPGTHAAARCALPSERGCSHTVAGEGRTGSTERAYDVGMYRP